MQKFDENVSRKTTQVIRECVMSEKTTEIELGVLLNLLHKNSEHFQSAVEQIILKTINIHQKLNHKKSEYIEKFFQQLFTFLRTQTPTKELQNFFKYFNSFFSIATFTNNHSVKWMFARYLHLLVDSKFLKLLDETQFVEVYDAAFNLLKDLGVRNKQIALKLLENLQKIPFIRWKAQNMILQAASVDPQIDIRIQALLALEIDQRVVDFFVHRIKDSSKKVQEVVLDKMINERIELDHLLLNTKCFLFNSCICSSKEVFRTKLTIITSPENLNIEEEYQRGYFHLKQIVRNFGIKIILRFDKVLNMIKETFEYIIGKYSRLTIEYIIFRAIHEVSVEKKYSESDFDVNLFILIQIIDFVNKKTEESFSKDKEAKKTMRTSIAIRTDPSFIEGKRKSVMKQEVDIPEQDAIGLNSMKENERYETYSLLSNYIDSRMPTNLKMLEIMQENIKRETDSDSAMRNELLFRLINSIQIEESVKEKFVELVYDFVENYDVSVFSFQEFLIEFNNETRRNLEGSVETCSLTLFLPEMKETEFIYSWLTKGMQQNREQIFHFDVLFSAVKLLQTFLTNEEFRFNDAMLSIIKRKMKLSKTKNDQLVISLLTCYFMEIANVFTENHIEGVQECLSKLFYKNGKEGIDKGNKKLYNFIELVLLKTMGVVKSYNPERMFRLGDLYVSILIGKDGFESSLEHKIISAAILIDFLLKFPVSELQLVRDKLVKQHIDSLVEIETVLDVLKRMLLEEKNLIFKSLLIKGFCKLFVSNREVFKFFKCEIRELIAIMIVYWHDDNLKVSGQFQTELVQFLSLFFITGNFSGPKDCSTIIESLVVLLELVFNMRETGACFDSSAVNFDLTNFQEKLTEVVRNFINLTLKKTNKKIADWHFNDLFLFNPQEFLFLYLLSKEDECPEYFSMANNILSVCDFWENPRSSVLKFFYSKIAKFIENDAYSKLGNIKKLFERYAELITEEEMESAETLQETAELNNFLTDKFLSLKTDSILLLKTLKSATHLIIEEKIEKNTKKTRGKSKKIKKN